MSANSQYNIASVRMQGYAVDNKEIGSDAQKRDCYRFFQKVL